MIDFKLSNTVNWVDINKYVENGRFISLDENIKLERHTKDFVLFGYKERNELFCFPVYNDKIFDNIKNNSEIVLVVHWEGKQAKLIVGLRDEHDIRVLSHGIRTKDNPKNINDIRDWVSKQLI